MRAPGTGHSWARPQQGMVGGERSLGGGLGGSKSWVGGLLKGGHADFLLPAYWLSPTPSISPLAPAAASS